jgi:hypothetical protein
MPVRIALTLVGLVGVVFCGYWFFHIGARGDPDGDAQVVPALSAGGALASLLLLGVVWITAVPRDR